jgi:hypothetical protein
MRDLGLLLMLTNFLLAGIMYRLAQIEKAIERQVEGISQSPNGPGNNEPL